MRHAPLAKKPSSPGTQGAPATRVYRAALLVAATCAAALGVALLASTQRGIATGCPPGMAFIEGATFKIGSDDGQDTPTDETPRRDVTVRSFCLDITEVTAKDYAACEACERPRMTVEIEKITPSGRAFWSRFCNGPEAGDHPINCVDWHEAKARCAASGKRLPTEAEWELAARGTEGRTYPWPGSAPPSGERLNACGPECSQMLTAQLKAAGKGEWPAGMYADDDAAPSTAPVGRYPAGASPAGVMDLSGNVWEWTESYYCPYDKDDCGDSRRVLRGGGWDTVESPDVRAASRKPSAPTARSWSVGFRCAKTL